MIRRPTPLFPALAVLALAAALTAGCGADEPGGGARAEPATPPDGTYTVRAEVVALPDPKRTDDRQLRVRHEAVPDFVGFEGEVVGMASMAMPFPLAEGVELEGIEAGDPVEMTFEVRWEGAAPLRIVGLRELPAGTELDFETAEPLPGEVGVEVEGAGSQPP
ncbi:MAG TPA: copper-binding protein [Thermoanaerobaculia bacterium]|nr:copper-binding protein [Thermoanaerobaculia bacterium]